MRITQRAWFLVAIPLVLLYEFFADTIAEVAAVAIGLSASLIGIARAQSFPRQSRIPWTLIATAGLLGLLGNGIRFWEAGGSTDLYVYPSLGDPLIVATYVALFVGLVQLVRRRSTLGESSYGLDAIVVAVCVGAITYWGFVGDYLSDTTVDSTERLINGVYWVLNLGVLAGVVRLAVGSGRRPRSYYLLLGGVISFSVTDLLTLAFITGKVATPFFEMLNPLVYVLLAAAVLDPSGPDITERPIAKEVRFTWSQFGVLAATLVLAPAIAGATLLVGREPTWSLIVGLPIVVAVLTLLRFAALMISERDRSRRALALRGIERRIRGANSQVEMIETAVAGVTSLLPARAEVRSSFIRIGPAVADESESRSTCESGAHAVVVYASGRNAEDARRSGDRLPSVAPLSTESVCRYDAVPFDLPVGAEPEVLVYHAPVLRAEVLVGSVHVTATLPMRRGDLDMIDHLATELGDALQLRELMDQLFRERAERRFKTLVENSSDIVMVLDGEDRIGFVSPAVKTVIGREEADVVGKDIRQLADGENASTVDRFIHATRTGTSLGSVELQLRRRDGVMRWFELIGRNHSDDADIAGLVVTARDITDRRTADDRLARSEARFRSLVQHSSDVIAVVDGSGIFAFVTPSVTMALGYRSDSLVGTSLFDLVAPNHRERVEDRLSVIGEPFTRLDLELDVKAASGRFHTLAMTLTDLRDEPAVDGIVLNARDITVYRSLEKDLEHQSVTDPLTGLPNRAGFIETLQGVLDDPIAPSPTVLLLDLDDFKTVNDGLGHGFGDDMLTVVADRLRTSLRLSDYAARLGGDEFAVLLRDAYTQSDVEVVLERLLVDLRRPVLMQGEDLTVSASVGVAMAGESKSAEDLLRNADAAMYRAKDAGKNRFEMFEEQIHTDMIERLELKNDLRRGISNDELVLYYQPIVNLATDRITGAEALVRWQHPRRGILAPGAFIGLAEESGLIGRIGQWVFEKACQQATDWNARRDPSEQLTMSINLSALQLETDESVDALLEAADRIGVDRSTITLELTESVLIQNLADRARLTRLQEEGFRLAVDDFGTGYSGLQYLQELPFDIIKVDRGFVTGVDTNVNRATFLESILDLAKGVGALTVGEGIEGGGELEMLKRLGFDFGQGYYFSRPVAHDLFADMIGLEQVSA